MTLAILVLYAQEVLSLSSGDYGLLLTGGAAGAVLGGIFAPRVIARLGPSLALQSALATFVLGPLIFVLAPVPWLVWLALLVEAFAAMQWNIVTVSLRQRTIPSEILGRVNSVYRFFGWGMMPAGSLLGGILVALLEGPLGRDAALRIPFLIASLAYLAVLIFAWRHFSAAALARAESR